MVHTLQTLLLVVTPYMLYTGTQVQPARLPSVSQQTGHGKTHSAAKVRIFSSKCHYGIMTGQVVGGTFTRNKWQDLSR